MVLSGCPTGVTGVTGAAERCLESQNRRGKPVMGAVVYADGVDFGSARFRRVRGRPFAGRPAAGLSAPARAREPFCDPRWIARTQGLPKSVDKPLSWGF